MSGDRSIKEKRALQIHLGIVYCQVDRIRIKPSWLSQKKLLAVPLALHARRVIREWRAGLAMPACATKVFFLIMV